MFLKIKLLLILMLLSIFNMYTFAGETTRKYDYKDFHAVEVGYGMHLVISQSNSYAIEVKADERDFEHLKVEKRNNSLRFYIDSDHFRKRGNIEITIKMPELTDLTLSGGSEGKIGMNISKDFEAGLSGGAMLQGSLKCANAKFSLSGGARMTLSGSGKDLDLNGSGGSIFKLKQFSALNADVTLSGGSDAKLKVNGKLRTSQSGGSHVSYSGNTVVESSQMSGGSKISKED
ncbi:MAG: head GIN domain-containing protein [Bacteroidota bacterium]|nr:head GIN domain-containing protein [Bacteroidota bacterium]MDP4194884.1 head GIN domain-containing protein [Bacteroidota bacterium]